MSRIRLTWSNTSTTIVEQRVYRSTSPLDIDDMPDPLAVLPRRNREYLDITIEDGLAYYYAVSSVLPDYSELISEEIKVETSPVESDPHWDKVVALLHFDGGLTDETGRIWQLRGWAVSSSDEYAFGGSSLFVPAGTRDGLYHGHSADFALAADDFTIEFYAYFLDGDSRIALEIGPASGWTRRFFIDRYEGKLRVRGGTSASQIHNGDIPINSWVHIAVTIQAGQVYGFLNGHLVGSVSGQLPTGNLAVGIGHVLPSSNPGMYGYIDEFRITKGVARYTENFTPPTKAFPNN